MNRTPITLIAIVAIALGGSALAQRHDERPHGYDAKVAAAQAAQASSEDTRLVPQPLGPRAQGTAQRVNRVAIETPAPAASVAVPQAEKKAN